MNPYVADTFASVRIADFHREAAEARLAAAFPRQRVQDRWSALSARFAAWAERARAGRTVGVCCPA